MKTDRFGSGKRPPITGFNGLSVARCKPVRDEFFLYSCTRFSVFRNESLTIRGGVSKRKVNFARPLCPRRGQMFFSLLPVLSSSEDRAEGPGASRVRGQGVFDAEASV